MEPRLRSRVAASVYALATGRTVAGLYDHRAAEHRRIAAEARGAHLQGYDGDLEARFGGTLPEWRDASDGTSLHLTIEGGTAQGYDRRSSSHFTAVTGDGIVQLYDHADAAWFPFSVQSA